ncbi:uncharacterized protein LOC124890860 [Capsicum annuum]|uniref:uncharacterized protein LOC124890860 n=1 Tax=Capsicum annuum TaxID=4072 RepID=UPI001FB09DB9|nr:uncharacterized protein LOC124890860 [Capsicum annuum]
MISIKLVIGESSWNIISAYAPHIGLDEDEKKRFWEALDEMVRDVPSNDKAFIGGDFNGHIGSSSRGYDDVHKGCGFGIWNDEGVALLNFARAFGLVIASCIREATREVLGVSRGLSSKHQGSWWWNEKVKKKVEAKKKAYAKFAESKDEEDKWKNWEYKIARRKVKLAVPMAKDAAFESLYTTLDSSEKKVV